MAKEAKARIRINDHLQRSGRRFFDDENGPANVALETHVKLKKKTLDEFGEDFEKTAHGFVDYLLLDERGFPIAVLEAKPEKFDPLVGKEQARKYVRSQNVRFVILSNGNLHYFWDLEQGNPVLITEFPTPESLGHFHTFKPNPGSLTNEKIESDYVAITQNPNYRNDPRWNNPVKREAFIKDTDLKFLRSYQLGAIQALQDAVKKGQTRFLFEMVTGAGKTLTAAAVIKLFMRTGNAKRAKRSTDSPMTIVNGSEMPLNTFFLSWTARAVLASFEHRGTSLISLSRSWIPKSTIPSLILLAALRAFLFRPISIFSPGTRKTAPEVSLRPMSGGG